MLAGVKVGYGERRGTVALAVTLLAAAMPASAGAATIETTTRADENGASAPNGNCTLREAVIAANTDAARDACAAGDGADTIKLKQGTYTLTIGGGDPNHGVVEIDQNKADLDIDGLERLTLIGHKKGTTIDAGGVDRAFDVFGKATLKRLTITGGAPGRNGGGGVRIIDGDLANGQAKLIGTTVRNNSAANPTSGGGSGIQLSGDGGRLELINSTVRNNAGAATGGIDTFGAVVLIIRGSTIANNSSTSGNGDGGLLLGAGAAVTILDSTIRGNDGNGAGAGGIGTNESDLNMRNTAITGNTSERDGGGLDIHDGETVIRESEISGNSADDSGGGIATSTSSGGPDLLIVNTTISGNTAYADAVYDSPGYEHGGGIIAIPGANTRIINSTIANNSAFSGGGIMGGVGFGTPSIRGALISGNASINTPAYPDCDGDVNSLGNNLLSMVIVDSTACTIMPKPTDKINVAAKIAGLADNGGPTRTHALRPGSKAINAGPAGVTPTDQRGVPRKKPDIGAYELARCGGVIVNRVGTGGRDNLRGTNGADGFLTFGGADRVSARGGRDGICTGGGRDRIDGGPGRDFCDGGGGRDRASNCERKRSIP